ncbi:KEOPS complex Pcc1-like subunit [Halapricum sp. CBA1109]|uniref:KEOPS complex subunit Pcc1 n=1 Tax=Halapricum sp. CBA1109 TaxID=2668068 RepID=UPI0013B79C8C|nr:KEOPS complex Pcc1-like subunit [Halapricum sp. CBA1109]
MTDRHARITTRHDDPEVVAAALAPDNTDEMTTRVEGDRVVTTVDRDSTGGLQATVDDYVVNLHVAQTTTDTDTTQS